MLEALIGSLTIMAISAIGALIFKERIDTARIHHIVLPLAVGVFLGVVFFELIPETFHASEEWGPIAVLVGFLGFYLLSHFLDTYHHHHADDHDECTRHGARKLLIGDAIHNFADGIVIATSFMINPVVGIATTIGIALHEIPQEIAEFGILRSAGYSLKRAIVLNLLSASTVVVGVLLTYLVGAGLEEYVFILTGIAAGNLLYIATTDLIPELRHSHRHHFVQTFSTTIAGVVFIGVLTTLLHH